MDVKRILVIKDIVFAEGGFLAPTPSTRVAACAVIDNPFAGCAQEDLSQLVEYGAILGDRLVHSALSLLSKPVVSYGKAAIVGVSGEIEHGAAILHPQMGKPIRAAIGGGKAVIPSNVKIGSVGTIIDVPLGHKDNAWSFDQIDTLSLVVPHSPRPNEVVVVVVLADGGRPRPRVGNVVAGSMGKV